MKSWWKIWNLDGKDKILLEKMKSRPDGKDEFQIFWAFEAQSLSTFEARMTDFLFKFEQFSIRSWTWMIWKQVLTDQASTEKCIIKMLGCKYEKCLPEQILGRGGYWKQGGRPLAPFFKEKISLAPSCCSIPTFKARVDLVLFITRHPYEPADSVRKTRAAQRSILRVGQPHRDFRNFIKWKLKKKMWFESIQIWKRYEKGKETNPRRKNMLGPQVSRWRGYFTAIKR